MRRSILTLSIFALICDLFAYEVATNSVTTSTLANVAISGSQPNWELSLVQTDNAYFDTVYWGIITEDVSGSTVYKVGYFGTHSSNDVWFTYDSLSSIDPDDASKKLPELKSADAGKVKVKLYDDPANDSIYLIVSDSLQTHVIAYYLFMSGASSYTQGWNHGNVTSTTYDDLTNYIVSSGNVTEVTDVDGWSISNGDLINGSTYSGLTALSIQSVINDNVWYQALQGNDTVTAKLQASAGYAVAQTHPNMIVTDNFTGWYADDNDGTITKVTVDHAPFYAYNRGDTMYVSSDSLVCFVLPATVVDDNDTVYYFDNGSQHVMNQDIDFEADIDCPQSPYYRPDYYWSSNRTSANDTISYDSIALFIASGYDPFDGVPENIETIWHIRVEDDNSADTSMYVAITKVGDLTASGVADDSALTSQVYADTLILSHALNIKLNSTIPAWMTINQLNDTTFELTGTPTAVGTYNVSIVAVDSVPHYTMTSGTYISEFPSISYRSTSLSYDISTSNPPNNPPVVANADTTASITVGESITFSISATDPDDDVLTYTSTVAGTQNGNSFTYTGLTVGFHSISLTATDPYGLSDGYNIILTVNDVPNEVPVIANADTSMTITVGSMPLTLTVNATDGNADDLTYSSDVTPTNQVDSTFTFDLAVGEHTITLAVDDGNGGQDSWTVTVTVENDVTSIDYKYKTTPRETYTVVVYNLKGQLVRKINEVPNVAAIANQFAAGNLIYKVIGRNGQMLRKQMILR